MARPDEDRVLTTISAHAASLLGIARAHSLCLDDAQDAYQRTLEIYLEQRDRVRPATEGEWLRTVCKHEAMRLRDVRQRVVAADGVAWDERPSEDARDVEERALAMERVAHAAEALQACKADESAAILLKAGGASYAEIGERTGWTYTKVNRALTEGRATFLRRFADIESGAACHAYGPVLSAVADGEARPEDYAALRPHLRHCAGCRATLRGLYEAQPALGALVPAGVMVAGAAHLSAAPDGPARLVARVYEGVVTSAGDKLLRAQAVVEAATTSKAAAVAATAAVAAGGVMTVGADAPRIPAGGPLVARAVGPAGTAARQAATARERRRTRTAVAARDAGAQRRPPGTGRAAADRTARARARAARAATVVVPRTTATATAAATAPGSGASATVTTAPAQRSAPAATAAPAAPSPATGDFGFEG